MKAVIVHSVNGINLTMTWKCRRALHITPLPSQRYLRSEWTRSINGVYQIGAWASIGVLAPHSQSSFPPHSTKHKDPRSTIPSISKISSQLVVNSYEHVGQLLLRVVVETNVCTASKLYHVLQVVASTLIRRCPVSIWWWLPLILLLPISCLTSESSHVVFRHVDYQHQ